jgi:Protein of unknown function (DUF3072)
MARNKTRETHADPKPKPNPPSNLVKEPDGWVSGREPMTGARLSYLKTLSAEVQELGALDEGLSQSEASKRIDALNEKLRLGELPPHTD